MNKEKTGFILLVEDEDISVNFFECILEKNGYKLLHVSTGEMAIDTINQNPAINLILMDVKPGGSLDGFKTASIILENHDIPVIFLIPDSEKEVAAKADEIESYGCLRKNRDETVIIATIKTAINLFYKKLKKKSCDIKPDPFLLAVLEQSTGCVLFMDLNSRIFYLNNSAMRLMNLCEGDLLVEKTTSCLDGSMDYPEIIEITLKNGFWHGSIKCQSDSVKSILSCRTQIVENANGEKSGLSLIADDISACRSLEEQNRYKDEKLDRLKVELININNDFKTVLKKLVNVTNVQIESKELYRTLFEKTGTGIIVIEEDKTISLANKVFAKSFGLSSKEIHNRIKWTELVEDKYLSFMIEQHNLRRISSGKAESHYEFSFRDKENILKHYLIYISMIPKTKKSIASIIDITERKNAEQSLEAAEEKYRNLFMNSQVGIFRSEIDSGLVIEANDRFAQLFGFKDLDEILNTPTRMESFYSDKSARMDVVTYLKKHGEIRNYEAQFKRKHGTVFWIRYSAKLIADKGWIDGVTEDITDLKIAEAEKNKIYNELLASEKKYKLIFENTPLGFIHFDNNGIITDCNPVFEQITGTARDEIIGVDMLGLEHAGVVAAVNYAISGHSGDYEGLYKFTKSSSDSLLRVQLRAIHDENENITGGVGIIEDVTDKRVAERAILEELEKERARIGHIMHDSLGQKLGAILYLTQALRKKYTKTGKLSDADMENLGELISSALDETRTLSRGLDLRMVETRNFIKTLNELAMRIRTIYSIEVDLAVNNSLTSFDKLKLTNLYYIILESINNAVRHGKARKIMLKYYSDNKKGFFSIESLQKTALKQDTAGMGLRIMKYRAEVAGMEFGITSEKKKVIVTVLLGKIPDA